MVDLEEARRQAWAPVVDSYDYDQLRILVLELCDEVESLRGLS